MLFLFYFQMNELVSKNRNIFLFYFPIILFDTTEAPHLASTAIEEHKLKFMQNLQNYFLFQSAGDHAKSSMMLGMANEMIYYLLQL